MEAKEERESERALQQKNPCLGENFLRNSYFVTLLV